MIVNWILTFFVCSQDGVMEDVLHYVVKICFYYWLMNEAVWPIGRQDLAREEIQ